MCVGRDGELRGCGFVVTMWRKVPSCMALLHLGAAEAATLQEEGGAAVLVQATPLVPSYPRAHPGWALPRPRAGVVSEGERRRMSAACFLSSPVAGTLGPGLLRVGLLCRMCQMFSAQPWGHHSHPGKPYALAVPRGQSLPYWLVLIGKMLAMKDAGCERYSRNGPRGERGELT